MLLRSTRWVWQRRRRFLSIAAIEPIIIKALRTHVGEDNVDITEVGQEQHGHDESWHKEQRPSAVIHPRSKNEVSECIRICTDANIKMVPFGTGTGLEGAVNLGEGCVCFNLTTNMGSIIKINAEDFDATVQPGVTRTGLNDALRHSGLWFPIDPGADASICGMAATSASGTNAVRYGTMRENVLNLEVILPNGDILHTAGEGGRARKTSAGFNLTNLFVGSEGSLGMITSATVRLHPLPGAIAAAVCAFDSIEGAINTSTQTIQCGVQIGRVEFLDDVQVRSCNLFSGLGLPEKPTIFFEFGGMSDESVKEQAELVQGIAQENGGGAFEWAVQQEDRAKLWKARHSAHYANIAMRPGCRALATDVCVPISELAACITEAKEYTDRLHLLAPIVGHVGDGNFHCLLLIDPQDADEMSKAKEFTHWLGKRAIAAGGTCTGEHGVGRGKRDMLEHEMGPIGLATMRTLKDALDPKRLMNPGAVFESS